MITILIIIGIVLYVSVGLWFIFNGMVGSGIPVLGIVVENDLPLLLTVVFLSGLLWPVLFIVPVINSVVHFFRGYL